MDVCTIVTRSHLAHARVLARSHARHHPGARCFVLVIDDDGTVDPVAEPFELVTVADLQLGAFDEMRASYDVLELATALKPSLLRHLLATRGDGGGIAYLDGDVIIHAPLAPVEQALNGHPVVLTPHLHGPLPRDGRRPAEVDILLAGFFNLGFIAVKPDPQADAVLDWWAERLLTDCRNAPDEGFFVDQRWMDLVPAIVTDLAVLEDPGCNLAYWNVLGRDLSIDAQGRHMVDGVPLRFLHLSGYDPGRPHELSRFQDRIRLDDEPILRELCDAWAAALAVEGWEQARLTPYGHGSLPSGMPLTPLLRAAYRDGRADGALPGSIFTPAGEAEFVAWLNERAPGAPRVTRLLQRIWLERGDLRHAFPDLTDEAGARGFLRWVAAYGAAELPIPDVLVPPEAAAQRPAARPSAEIGGDAVPGVNVAGYLRGELGIGEIARRMVSALDAVGVPVAPVELHAPNSRQGHPFAALDPDGPPLPVNLICVNADGVPDFARNVGERFFEDRHNVGLWWWETDAFPEEYDGAFAYVDEIWAGTSFVAQTLAAAAPVPVVHIPMPVIVPPAQALEPGELEWPEGFTFLCVYDYNSAARRKNPVGAVRAFSAAFGEGEGPVLVMKSINAERFPRDHAEVLAAADGRSDIVFLDDYLEVTDRDRLMASCDCYVSLHRAEGLGLMIAEAMYLGKPVIATGYSGNMDYMTAANSLAVDFTLVPVGEGAPPYPPQGRWAEPDVAHAAQLMRRVFDEPQAAREIGARAAADLRAGHSLQVTGRAAEARLRRIARRLDGGDRPPLPEYRRAVRLLGAGSSPRAPASGGRPGAALRRILLRAIRPYSFWQDEINRALDDDARAAERRLSARVSALHARTLGQLREQERELAELRAQLAARPAAASAPPVPPSALAGDRSRICAVTVAPKARLAEVRVLAGSLARTNSGIPLVWVLSDEPDGLPDPAREPFELLVASDLGVPGVRELAFQHDREGFAAALVPSAIEHVLG
ncbi:MAG: glycosyltransferase, partial [Actinobacteria bacterium]|nr:glycosyltransferase [Actinomycetota bacterium]